MNIGARLAIKDEWEQTREKCVCVCVCCVQRVAGKIKLNKKKPNSDQVAAGGREGKVLAAPRS